MTARRPWLQALVSRQYMDMSRIRIEGLLAAFPKLVGTGKQHTYVETENVRYVYQPMEVSLPARRSSGPGRGMGGRHGVGSLPAPPHGLQCGGRARCWPPRAQGMFLLLVTNRGSNILEDLDTLRLLSKLVPEYAGVMLDEDAGGVLRARSQRRMQQAASAAPPEQGLCSSCSSGGSTVQPGCMDDAAAPPVW